MLALRQSDSRRTRGEKVNDQTVEEQILRYMKVVDLLSILHRYYEYLQSFLILKLTDVKL